MTEDTSKPEELEAAALAIVPAGFVATVKADLLTKIAPHLESKRKLYEGVAALAPTVKATDAESLARATALRVEILRERDGLEAVRKAGPGAFDAIARTLNAEFKPLRDLLDAAAAALGEEIGGYVVSQRAQQTENYQAAAAAHAAGEHADAQVALSIASEAETSAPRGTSVREVWEIDRYDLGLMVLSTSDRPGLAPDEKAIRAYLRTCPTSQASPGLPGVVCKKVPAVTQRRA